MNRYIVIGDIHGCIEEFVELLDKVKFRPPEDKLYLVGDLIDRGPDPKGVLQHAMNLGARLIKGNHEEKMLRWLNYETRRRVDPKFKNPIDTSKIPEERQAEWLSFTDEQLAWVRRAPFTMTIRKPWIMVHAGMEPGFPLEGQRLEQAIRVRYVDQAGEAVGSGDAPFTPPPGTVYWTEAWKGPESVIYGHAVHSRRYPRIDAYENVDMLGIDTGCCYGGRLTAVVLTDEPGFEFVQVQARKEYMRSPVVVPDEVSLLT